MSVVNRDTKTPASLLALARTRRMQRALAHASLHRGDPLPTLRSSLGYMTSTARVADDGAALGHPAGIPSGQGAAGPLTCDRSLALGHPAGIPSGQGAAGPLTCDRSLALGHPAGVSSGQGIVGPLPRDRSLALGQSAGLPSDHDRSLALGHCMTVLGVSPPEGVAYVVEEISHEDAPIVYRLYLHGPRQGHLVPLRAWYEQSDSVREIRARIAALAPTLDPVYPTTREAWMLSTRIIQRRALRVAGPGACAGLAIRKFALQFVVEPVGAHGPAGRSTVTAFLQPHAQLTTVWSLSPVRGAGASCEAAIARVTFTGIPSGTGLTKDTVVLLTAGLWGLDRPVSLDESTC